ncbi:hypothetical protein M9H77_14501 [Catharanthus roseus]|uniref:Uncharacterized protein n=1 Tax=Catharanthus roseus TaxID=4058 RepID=A0ACC0BN73_CATRO|nr:hypothetical protein M9H77_14501 [Catharanthus roseus]
MVTRIFPPVNSSSYKKVPPAENYRPIYLRLRAVAKSSKPRRGAGEEYGEIGENGAIKKRLQETDNRTSKQRCRSQTGEEAAVTSSCRNPEKKKKKRQRRNEQQKKRKKKKNWSSIV